MSKVTGSQIGRPLSRLESHAKVTGAIEYTDNVRLPGMLYGKIVRSTVAHGHIVKIDTSAASKASMVHSIITGDRIREIIPDPYYGPVFHDQPILALGKVRHVGEPVAVVLAQTQNAADEAAQMVVVDYDELPQVFDEVEAADAQSFVHEELRPAGGFPDFKHLKGLKNTNIAIKYKLRHGNVAQAFVSAHRVFEHTFRTRQTVHVPLEPFVSIAEATKTTLTIYSATQSPSFLRIELARLLGWSESQIQVRAPFLGGSFGAKLYVKLEALVAALAMIARRPVKIALSMEEQFYIITKHATTIRIKSGVDKDGAIVGRECEIWWNGGAYADIGPRVTQKSSFAAAGPYNIPAVNIDAYAVYTNLPPAGAQRGFGIPQLVWAYESHTDLIARELNMDPVELRRRNLLRRGEAQATGTVMQSDSVRLVFDTLVEKMNWGRSFDRGSGALRRGRGVAIGFKASISSTTSLAAVNIGPDGSCTVHCATVDMGQGSDTAMAQIAGEVLHYPAESIRIVHSDTDTSPYDMGTIGSRSTYHMGHAVRLAAEDALRKIQELKRELGLPEGTNLPISELFKRKYGMVAGGVVGMGSYYPKGVSPDLDTGQSPDITPYWMIGATGADVEVNTRTGGIRILKLYNVVDAGRPINPKIVATQISGAATMQLGATLLERVNFDNGQVTNASFSDYKIPGIKDVPPMDNYWIDLREEGGPYGAKGVGESAVLALSPAVANAIHDAVGIRMNELPITSEVMLKALLNNGHPG